MAGLRRYATGGVAMSRLMSVTLTADQVVDRTKTVTRRLGWLSLKEGDTLTLCRKVMGRKPGEPLERLAEVQVVSARREPLRAITREDIAREGFASAALDHNRDARWDFITFFCEHMKCKPDTLVTRIEWRYL